MNRTKFYGFFKPDDQLLFFCGDYGIDKKYLTLITWAEYHSLVRIFKSFSKATCVRIAVGMKRKINSWKGEPNHDNLIDYYFSHSKIKGIPVKTTTPQEINLNYGILFKEMKNDFRKVCGITGDHLQGSSGGDTSNKRRRKKRKKTKVSNNTLKRDQVSRGIEQDWSKLEAQQTIKKENGTHSIVV